MFRKEINHQKEQNKQLIEAESEIFRISLGELKKACNNQATKIEGYIERKDFILEFDQGVNVDFLKFFDIKNLYEKIGFKNQEHITQLNELLSSLYTLNDFGRALTNELRTYIDKYNSHEKNFYIYRKVLYTEYFYLLSSRGYEITGKAINIPVTDDLMISYSRLRDKIFQNPDIIFNNELKSRELLVNEFIIPLSHKSSEFIPGNPDAIKINDLLNQVNSAFTDMVKLTDSHFRAIQSYKQNLETLSSKIDLFLAIS